MIDDSKPIFVQIAELIENGIVDGTMAEESQVPSTNDFAAFHRINPATAAKGVNLLVDSGILYKRRGIGMFVATGARAQLVARRTEEFFEQYVKPLALEARKLGITTEQLNSMIERSSGLEPDNATDKERSAAL
ncbi:GntR family transcriptional regulator [Paenarthrobacter aurescens]|uniref:GntR family transcriptional regulator n=1 Tax=Paenarthrobacter aurescens TaxID=43663 RepID=A0A4Y3NHB6_PAEAU|nr:GntR family transcriptional regulator [Paenarthrobacter aurescens]UKA48401.1 GntR family transcriptional regulator [Arthrobacter sp. FW305-123]MDO6143989.1 GntR family transcriptional regulator [Paenarthrobacter aurescens]MDO6147836.1 GntR family transcriptional regulator [Paenarthrobacter aurescens]MDO6159080.1 GntR family transcriptional regulator [Paenarthrobacter aurescens]MDO6163064.1 GntR family transcriptional regulator [Paenarthrobacter aurescens]